MAREAEYFKRAATFFCAAIYLCSALEAIHFFGGSFPSTRLIFLFSPRHPIPFPSQSRTIYFANLNHIPWLAGKPQTALLRSLSAPCSGDKGLLK